MSICPNRATSPLATPHPSDTAVVGPLPKTTQSSQSSQDERITSGATTRSTPSPLRDGSGQVNEALVPGDIIKRQFPQHVNAMSHLLRSLSKDVMRASLMAGPTSSTQSIRHEVERLLRAICSYFWGDAIVLELYGSYATATALDTSDLNISLSSNKDYHLDHQEAYLGQLAEFTHLHLRDLFFCSIDYPRGQGVRLSIKCYATWGQLQSLNTVLTTPAPYLSHDYPRSLLRDVARVMSTIHLEREADALSVPRECTMSVRVGVDQHQAVNHALYFNQLVSSFPELTSFLILVKAHCADVGLESSHMTSTLLAWTAVAYFRHHLLQLGSEHSSPAQVFLGFVDYFREGGAFDPRVHLLCPGHPSGIVHRATPAKQSQWVVIDPFVAQEVCDTLAESTTDDGHLGELATHNIAIGCYLAHMFRRSIGLMLHNVLSDYGDAVVPGGVTRLIQSPLEAKVGGHDASRHVTGAAAPRPYLHSVERLICATLPRLGPQVLKRNDEHHHHWNC
jgi:hypothetical protein